MNLPALLPPPWQAALAPFLDPAGTAELGAFVAAEYAAHTIYPPAEDLFAAYRLCPPDRTRVLKDGAVGCEDSHNDRNERERDREHLKPAEASFQLWLVAALPTLLVGDPGIHHAICRHPDTWPFIDELAEP